VTNGAAHRRLARLVLAEAPGTIDDELATIAVAEGVAPLLGAWVVSGRLDASTSARACVTRAYHASLAETLLRERSLAPAWEALRARAIPLLLLKGAALQRGTYPYGARPMVDVDVLVPARRWREAVSAVEAVGFARLDDARRPFTVRHDYVRALAASAGPVVELHRGLAPRWQFSPPLHPLFERARREPDGFLVPAPVDLFLSLAVHAAKHAFALPLRSFVDGLLVARLVSPGAVIQAAQAARARRATAAWLVLLLDLGLPGDGWSAAAAALGAPLRLVEAIQADPEPVERGWRYQLRVARIIDSHRHVAAWLAERASLRLIDAVWHAVARAGRAARGAA
jgi:hypothetical protein